MHSKVKKSDILILLFSIMMIRPYYIQLNDRLNRVWAYITLILAVYSLVIIILRKKTRYIIAEAVFFGIYIIATFLSYPNNLLSAVSIVGQAALGYNIGVLLLTKHYHDSVERIVPKVFTAYLYLDALSVVLGISTRVLHVQRTMTLLGYDNYAAFYVLPMLAVKMGLSLKKKGRLSREDWICWGACTLTKILTASYAASLILILFAVIILMVDKGKNLRKLLNVKNAVVFVVLLFVGIYFFNIQNIIAGLLTSAGKGVELNSRTVIWRNVIRNFRKIPLVGIGNNTPDEFLAFFGFPFGWSATHAHNIILDLMIQTGILGILTYINILRELRVEKVLMKNRWYQIFIIGIICYIILGFFDFYFYLSAFWLLISLTKSEAVLEQSALPISIRNSSMRSKAYVSEIS